MKSKARRNIAFWLRRVANRLEYGRGEDMWDRNYWSVHKRPDDKHPDVIVTYGEDNSVGKEMLRRALAKQNGQDSDPKHARKH